MLVLTRPDVRANVPLKLAVHGRGLRRLVKCIKEAISLEGFQYHPAARSTISDSLLSITSEQPRATFFVSSIFCLCDHQYSLFVGIMAHSTEKTHRNGQRLGSDSSEKQLCQYPTSGSVLSQSPTAVEDREKDWPSGWRPYTALFVRHCIILGQQLNFAKKSPGMLFTHV